MSTASRSGSPALPELARLFLKLGTIGFGGPAAHIALMHHEVVDRRRWLSEQHFLDLMGATNLIPGPNSTELAIHIGRERAGWKGLVVAGAAFIAPAMVVVVMLAWLYVEFGTAPAAESLLYGVAPVVVAIVGDALWKLSGIAVKNVAMALLGVVALALFFAGMNELLILGTCGIVVSIVSNRRRIAGSPLPLLVIGEAALPYSAASRMGDDLWRVFLLFVKFGSVVFGSGYVLLAFIRADLVTRLGWLTNEQLLDAVAIGQITPGPVFTTATFIGYIVAGLPGAVVATVGIFLPSFLFVAALNPLLPRIRRSSWLSAALDGVNVGSVALMAAVTLQLGASAIGDPLTLVVAAGSFAAIRWWGPNPAWLILFGAICGIVRWLVLWG